ncbi:hypothetical protein [Nocardia sp. alder85J]|uniref:hypothetical protein n=1 Tax=Nocardia sp. alder85J TaxID=2862949 RepID=UPI001CD66968|nr:hypothetical protein [Nocardia sp. alder85J]MCX4094941.1 hypothetical protein [Nocardia sp. alder85J]
MGEQFSADLDVLRDQALGFDRVGAEVAASVQRLLTSLSAAGAPWGDDDGGKAFAASYLPEFQQVRTDLNTLAQIAQQTGADLRRLADNFENQDLVNRQTIGSQATTPRQILRSPSGAVPNSAGNSPVTTTSAPPAAISTPTSETNPTQTPGTGYRGTAMGGQQNASSAADPAAGASGSTAPGTGGPGSGQPGSEQPGSGPDSTSPQAGADGADTGPTDSEAAAGIDPGGVTSAADRPAPGTSATEPVSRTPRSATRADATAGGSAAGNAPEHEQRSPGSSPRGPGRSAARPAGRSDRPERQVSQSSSARPGESLAARLARELAERHGVDAFGFETPGVADDVLIELAAAVDDVLSRYPAISLAAVGIDDLPDGENTRLHWDSESPADPADLRARVFADTPAQPATPGPAPARLTVATHAATDPERLREETAIAERAGLLAPGCARRPVYSSIVRELGTALDLAGGFRARTTASRQLLTACLPGLSPADRESLRRTVSGFREWRSQLRGRSFPNGRFDPATALPEAFTDVVLNGPLAAPPAVVLHDHLVEAADSMGHHRQRLPGDRGVGRAGLPE